ncbi:MAG: YdcF family protein [Lachnospiraceae bacterium]|nr:YdcF family protein [Lachnospiraceae bacterium]
MRKKVMTVLCILAAFLCFLYCFIVFRIRSGSHFYLIWALGGLFFIGLALMVRFDLWSQFPPVLRRVVCGVLIAGILAFVVAEGCIFAHYRDKGRPDLDYIIVLGAQMKPGGPSVVLRFRLDAAYDYLTANEDTLCVVSGGQGANEPCSEAEGMYTYLVEKGIAPERILMEDKSTDTAENIAFSAELIGGTDKDVGIVTNNFHVFRGVMLARHAGFEDACGISARSNVYFQPNNLVREFFGIIKDLVCGNLI